jgi:hypothetical protein
MLITRTNRARRLSALLLCVLPAAALADTTTVTLNGKTYDVETTRGFPVRASSPDFEMQGLGAISGTPESPDSMAWMWQGTIQREGSFSVTVTTPLDENVSLSFDVNGRERLNRFLFASSEYPTVWAWLDAEGTSWFPLVFTFKNQVSTDTFEITQWLRFDDDSKAAFKALREAEAFVARTNPEKATVYVLRGSNMRMQGQSDVFVDETPIAVMPRLSYLVAEIDPGWHLIWGDCPAEWFELKAGRAYLLRTLTGPNAGQACLEWAVGVPDDIASDIAQLGLTRVEPSEEQLTELRAKAGGYAKARKRAGEPPAETAATVVQGFTYSAEPPKALATLGFGKRGGSVILGATAVSYASNDQQLEIPLADIRAFRTESGCVRVRYGQEQALRDAYFCSDSTPSRNRMLMHLLNSAPQ